MTNGKEISNANSEPINWSLVAYLKELPLSNLEKVATFLYIISLLGGLAFLQRGNYTDFIPAASLVYPVLYVYFFVKFFSLPRIESKLFAIMIPIGALAVSALLSYAPMDSLLPILSLVMNTMFAYWISTRVGRFNFLLITLVSVIVLHVMAIPFGLLDLNYIIYNDPMDRASLLGLPNYEALFPHKIQAGIYSGLGALIALRLFDIYNLKKYLYLAVILFGFNLASGSSLAFSSLFIAMLLAFSIVKIKNYLGLPGVVYFVLWLIFLTFCLFYFDVYESVLSLLGRDPGLTGRTENWRFGLDYILRNPLFGGGFGVFFTLSPESPAQELWSQMHWYKAPSFHNGYIELFAEGGAIATIAFFFVIAAVIINELNSDKIGYVNLTIVLMLLITNLGAAVLIKANVYLYVLLIVWFFTYEDAPENVRLIKVDK